MPQGLAAIYRSLTSAEKLAEALTSHFGYLADSPGFDSVLREIMAKAKGVSLEDQRLVVDLGKYALAVTPPADPKIYRKWPASYRAIVSHHQQHEFPPDSGDGIVLGGAEHRFEPEFLEETSLAEVADDVRCPIADGADWWLYHPTEKTAQGEPALCFLSHEGGDVEAPTEWRAGSVFLRRVAKLLDVALPSAEPTLHGLVVEQVARGFTRTARNAEWFVGAAVSADQTQLVTVQLPHVHLHDLSDPFAPRPLGGVTVPGATFENLARHVARVQFIENHRIAVLHEYGFAFIDATDPQQLRVEAVREFEVDDGALEGPVVLDGNLYFYRSSSYPDPGLKMWPLGAESPETLALPSDGYIGQVSGIARRGERLLMCGQEALVVYAARSGEALQPLGRAPLDVYAAELLPLDESRFLQLELARESRQYAVRIWDVSKPKPRAVEKLLPRAGVVGYTLAGNDLWLLLRSKQGYALSRVTLKGSQATVTLEPTPLPSDLEGEERLEAMWVSEGAVALLIGDGRLLRCALGKTKPPEP